MASIFRPAPLRAQLTSSARTLRPLTSLPSIGKRHNANLANLQQEMTSRTIPLIFDDMSPLPSYRLNMSLANYLPESWINTDFHNLTNKPLPPSHHLVYFNPAIQSDMLLPDGTDPLQSPGDPYKRRMWAGGSIRFPHPGIGRRIRMDGKRGVCLEKVRDVNIKGKTGNEKIFVGIERRFGGFATGTPEEQIREMLWSDDETDFARSRLIERRNIVFMKERSDFELKNIVEMGEEKTLKPQHTPHFSHTLTPQASLLFRFSALTFNAHSIHLDKSYCRDLEGHRNLLFHGPLSGTLLLQMLNARIGGTKEMPDNAIETFEYRNLAPLYCDEEMRLCGVETGEGKYELWGENSNGGVCVKGTARSVKVEKGAHDEIKRGA